MSGNNIQFRVSAIDDFSKTMRNFDRGMNGALDRVAKSTQAVSDKTLEMAQSMGAAYKDMKSKMDVFKVEQMAVEYQFLKLGQSTDKYAGKTNEFMGEIVKLGKTQKTITDNMVKNNEIARVSFYETVGGILNRSTQSEKIAQNLDRMNNPIYNLSRGSLQVAQGLEQMALKGNAAVLALKQLGPTANMKDLRDMTTMINRGIVRMQALQMVFAIIVAGMVIGLSKLAFHFNKDLAPLADKLKSTWLEAMRPIGEVFGAFLEWLFKIILAVGQMIVQFNTMHPILAKVIQTFLMLIPVLVLLLAPLAIGIGLTGGLAAAFTALWMAIGPFVVGLATVIGIAVAVAAALVALGAAIYLLWTRTTWFKEAVITVWEAIKSAWTATINAIKAVVISVMTEMSSFFDSELSKIRSFWDKNGADIMRIVTIFMAYIATGIRVQMAIIQAIFTVVWSVIKGVTVAVWNMIKGQISGAITAILGVIKVFTSVLQGDWKGAWEGVKQITKGAMQMIGSIVGGMVDIGRNIVMGLINGIKSAAGQLMSTAKSIAANVTKTIKGALKIKSPSRVMMELGEFTGIGLAKGMEGTLGAITKSSMGMANATVAPIRRNSGGSSVTKTTNNSPVNITLNYSGSASRNDAQEMLRFVSEGLAKELEYEARINGVKI